jgi:DNA-binding transcriptional MerR regulator
MKVGEVAAAAGVSVRSVRYYESAGLLYAVRRANGYREFDASAVERVRAIRDLLETGFTIEDVVSLSTCLQGAPGGCDCCGMTVALYREKLARIEQQVQTLTAMRDRITKRIAQLEPC